MGALNSCTFIGNLGRDAEMRYTPGGVAVAKFSIACSETWTGKDGQKNERTEWVNVETWGRSAESLAEYLTKGKQVCVVGRLQTDEYTDKDGVKRRATKIRADRIVLLGGGGGGGQRSSGARGGDEFDQRRGSGDDDHSAPLTDDDIPFIWALPWLLPALLAVHQVLA